MVRDSTIPSLSSFHSSFSATLRDTSESWAWIPASAGMTLFILLCTGCSTTEPVSPRKQIASHQEWAMLLIDEISKHWDPPADAKPGVNCSVRVSLYRNGKVRKTRLLSPCGSETVNRSVLTAVQKASPVTVPVSDSVFESIVILEFRPE
jgi:outer membrane biosynthesis protein TonB